MKYFVDIKIMPLKVLLDPQGKVVTQSIKNLGLNTISNIRVGKHINLEVEAETIEKANSLVDEACKKLLCNQIMESYQIELTEIK